MVQKNTSLPLHLPRAKTFYSQEKDPPRQTYAYCDCVTHRSWECNKITWPTNRWRILQNKKLCFNCTGSKHRAPQCRSHWTCVHFKQRHHSSICDKVEGGGQQTNHGGVVLTASLDGDKVCHLVVFVKVNGITCRALLDTSASVSYASGYLLNLLKLVPTRSLTRRI